MASALMAHLCVLGQAQSPSIAVYGLVDKDQYARGEEGKLTIWIMNTGDEPLILVNITVIYPWYIPALPLEGNETIKLLSEVILVDGNKSYEYSFTVPTDGRAISGSVAVWVETDKVSDGGSISLNVASPPLNMKLQDMDNLVTLITVQIIVSILAALIVAAAIFLSGRRPGVA